LLVPDELTDAAAEIFASEENDREQRRKKRAERERKDRQTTKSTRRTPCAFSL